VAGVAVTIVVAVAVGVPPAKAMAAVVFGGEKVGDFDLGVKVNPMNACMMQAGLGMPRSWSWSGSWSQSLLWLKPWSRSWSRSWSGSRSGSGSRFLSRSIKRKKG